MGSPRAQMLREATDIESYHWEWAKKLKTMESEFNARELAEDTDFESAKLAIEESVQQERRAFGSNLSQDDIQRTVDRIIQLTLGLAKVEMDHERSKAQRREVRDQSLLQHFETYSSQFPPHAVAQLSKEKLAIGGTFQREVSETGRHHGTPQVENANSAGAAPQSVDVSAKRDRPAEGANSSARRPSAQPVPQAPRKDVPPGQTANFEASWTPSTMFAAKRKTPHEANDGGSRRSDKRPRVKSSLGPTSADSGRAVSPARTISYDEVYQGGKAEYKHVIIEHPLKSNQWYILKCDEHRVHFGRNPLIGGGKHLWSIQHEFTSKKDTVVVGLLGHLVLGCTATLADQNNQITLRAFEQGYEPFNFNKLSKGGQLAHLARLSPLKSSGNGAHAEKDGSSAPNVPASQGSALLGRVPPKPFNGIVDPIAGELYLGYWSHNKTKYAVIVLPWGDLRACGMSGTLASTGLLGNTPRCYRVNRLTREIRAWSKGYEDGGPLVTKREFPIMYFDGKNSVSWMKAKHLSPFNLEDPNSRLIPHFDTARDYYAHKIHGFRDYADMKEQGGVPAPNLRSANGVGAKDHVPNSNGGASSAVSPREAPSDPGGPMTATIRDQGPDEKDAQHHVRPAHGQAAQEATESPAMARSTQVGTALGDSGVKHSRGAILSAPTSRTRELAGTKETQGQQRDTQAAATTRANGSVPPVGPPSEEPPQSGGQGHKQNEMLRSMAADKAPLAPSAQTAPTGDQDSSHKSKSDHTQPDSMGSHDRTHTEVTTSAVAALRAVQEAAIRAMSSGAPEQEAPVTNVSLPSIKSLLGGPEASPGVEARLVGILPQDKAAPVVNPDQLSTPKILSASISKGAGLNTGVAPVSARGSMSPAPRSGLQAVRTVGLGAGGTSGDTQGSFSVSGSSISDRNPVSEGAAPAGSATIKLIRITKWPGQQPPHPAPQGRYPASTIRPDEESLRLTAAATGSKASAPSQPQLREQSRSSAAELLPAARADLKTELATAALDREGYYDLQTYLDSEGTSFARKGLEPCLRLAVNPVARLAETQPGGLVKVTINPFRWHTVVLETVDTLGKTVVRLDGAESRTAELTFDESMISGRKQNGIVQARRFIRWMRAVNPALEYKNNSK